MKQPSPAIPRQVAARLARHGDRVRAFRAKILAWFRRHGRTFPWRNDDASMYMMVVSELLLQRTRAETVAAFFPRFIQRFPGWAELARASDTEMRAFLEPIGLWRRRAAALRELGRAMEQRNGCFPLAREELEQLPGIGQYIASAAMVFCHGGREPLLDVNMARVLERVFGARKLVDIRYDPWLQHLAREVVRSPRARMVNWAILDLAAKVCTIRNPRCPACPLRNICLYAARPQRRQQPREQPS